MGYTKVAEKLKPKIEKYLDSRMVREEDQWAKQSIHKVPASIIDLNKKAYKPQTVSLGPYHHGEDHLKAMDEHKLRALVHFQKRSGKCIMLYVEALAEVLDDLKGAYDQLGSEWQEKNEEFLELMILDGCFILEILMHTSNTTTQTLDDYAPNDPIFSRHGKPYIVPYLRRDMLLLENQLPLLVLEKLVAVEKENPEQEKFVTDLILNFFFQEPVVDMGKCLHILDVYRKRLLRDPAGISKTGSLRRKETSNEYTVLFSGSHPRKEILNKYAILFSATKLKEAAIVFQPSQKTEESKTRSLICIEDISFHRGVLKLPFVLVNDDTETVFRNLIAFERLHADAGKEFNSYIYFMGNIIKEARDVCLLHSSGIIKNSFGSDEAVASLFNSIAKDVDPDSQSRFEVEIKNVSDHCKISWNAWRADIMQNQCRNPWATLSVIAAILLFALTIIQTVFSVLSYVNHNS